MNLTTKTSEELRVMLVTARDVGRADPGKINECLALVRKIKSELLRRILEAINASIS